MAEEDLFRLGVIRPPIAPNPRYSPILLSQSSPFQTALRNAVASHPNEPRAALSAEASTYVSSTNFAPVDPEDANNAKLDLAAKIIDNLSGLEASPGTQPAPTHANLVEQLKTAFATTDLVTLTWFAALEARLKDSIIALRLLGIEKDTGSLGSLAWRLRVIGVTRKAGTDANFPLAHDDLRKYFQRPLQVPAFADLKPVTSTASQRAAAATADREQRTAVQAKIETLYSKRFVIDKAIKEILALPVAHRVVVNPKPFRPAANPADLSNTSLALRQLDLVQSMSSLMTQAFEMGLGKTGTKLLPQQLSTAAELGEVEPARAGGGTVAGSNGPGHG